MLVEHRGSRRPPTAVLCGDVRVGADARILFGAVISAEDGHVGIGPRCVVMEHALVRVVMRPGKQSRASSWRTPAAGAGPRHGQVRCGGPGAS